MSKVEQKNLLPKLRFPEFRERSAWEKQSLGDVFKDRQDQGFAHLPLLSLTEKYGIIPQVETNRKNNSSPDKSKYLKVCTGDVAYNTMRMWEGRSAYVDKDGLVSPAYTVCKPKNDNNGLFFSYYFKTHRLIEQFHKFSQGLVKDTLNLKFANFSKIEVLVPDANEQKKIADCLSSIDALITAQSQKIDALNNHKKGLMQQLFPQDGETIPKLRFSEFSKNEGWTKKKLKNVAIFAKGKGISKSDIAPNGALPCIRYGELYTNYNETINTVISYTNLNPDGLVLSQANDVIIPASGETQIDIATASCVLKSGIALGGDLNIIRTKMNGTFLSYYLNNAKKRDIAQLAQGIAVVHLYSSQLKNLDIHVPKLEEQEKIANFLSSLDTLITAHNQRLEALKAHKIGLMQQLFPTNSEFS